MLYRAVGRDLVPGNEDYLADDGTPAPSAFNCMAAVSDVTPGGGIRLFIQSGIQGTQQVVDAFGPNVLDRPLRGVRVHDRHRWLALRTQLSRFNPLFRNGLELRLLRASVHLGRRQTTHRRTPLP